MKLFLLRHGDRSAGYGDVPLSSEGAHQAQRLAENSELQKTEVILSSPKIRTQQTVTPLADRLQIPIELEGALDQRKSVETQSEFIKRVMNFISWLPEKYPGKNVLLCTHSDWLQVAILNIATTHRDPFSLCFLGCAEYRTLTSQSSLWDLQ